MGIVVCALKPPVAFLLYRRIGVVAKHGTIRLESMYCIGFLLFFKTIKL